MSKPPLPDPEIAWSEDGTPVSGVSGDVYFSRSGGIGETTHVFLGGIGAPECWAGKNLFRIAELGFGTGLNFLVTWKTWRETASKDAILDFVSFEGFPINAEVIAQAFEGMNEIKELARTMTTSLPPRVLGVHRLYFDQGRVRLTLHYGDISETMANFTGHVDAWYLDGFSPAKNADMWSDEVLAQIARHAASGARVTTFTAAGHVRRKLEAGGFDVSKRPGYGRKRECVTALMTAERPEPAGIAPGARIAVIGAGVAGCAIARALSLRGYDVTLVDKAPCPGSGASGNPAALIAPRLTRERVPLGRIMASAYLHAIRFYDGLAAEGADAWIGSRGSFVMARSDDEDERQRRALATFGWPENVMRRIDADEASALCGVTIPTGGLWFAGAGVVNPAGVTGQLSKDIAYKQADILEPSALLNDGFAAVVVAAGVGVPEMFAEKSWPIRPNRGQISYVPKMDQGPLAAITYGGYLSPLVDLGDGRSGHVLGATYARRGEVPGEDWERLREQDTAEILENLKTHLPTVTPEKVIGGRTSLRATVRDYLPLVGRVSEGIYVLGGFGSRGFLTAPLIADLLADQIAGYPLPLDSDLVQALDPGRFD